MFLSPGARVGPYEIRAAVGAGGMGEVYRAHDPRLGRDVALKILPEAMAKDEEGLARFTREARAVAALNHPHIVTIFSTEEADGVRFMTMELIEGRTLDRMIPQGGLSLAQFFDVSMAIADALSAAHQKQITHRDLKPANVMVTDGGRVKVLDFGLARGGEGADSGATQLEEQATRQKLTQAGTILGTMPYMSPEQIEAKALDGRSDIFSLGIVMYEMATGGRPFRGDSSPALMSSIMREHPKPASELRPDLPGDVSRLVGKCLEKHPRDRIQTAHEILLELKALRRAWESGASSTTGHPKTQAAASDPATRPARAEDLRIAVLPFAPRPASGEAEALADGLTEDIAAGLARFPILRVVSRAEVDRLRGQVPDAVTAMRMSARYFVDGSVRVAGPSLRVSARLVDANTGTHLWAETYERSMEAGMFALQDDVASRVIASVADSNGALVRSMAAALRDRPVEELSNPELLLRFEVYIQRYRVEEHAALRQAFEVAVQREPNDANAWAALATLVAHELALGYNPRPNTVERARGAIERSIEIDSTCARGWLMLAGLRGIARDLSGLRTAAQRLIEINPLDTAKLAAVAWMLTCAGDLERGEELARRSMSLHSNTAGWYQLPAFFRRFFAGDYRDALEAAKRIGIDSWTITHLATASAAGQAGSPSDARGAIESLRRIEPEWVSVERARAWYGGWVWDEDAVDRLVEGFEKALLLAEAEPSRASTARVRSGQTTASGVNRDYVVAIHPFTSHGSDEESTGLARGLTEDIGTALSRFQYFTVRTSKDADARYAVEGSVRRSGNSIRVSARLIDTDTGASVWAENYDRTLGATSFFDLQDEITARVASTIGSYGGPLVKAMASPLRKRPVGEMTLDQLVLRFYLFLGSPRTDEHALLRRALEKALADQPSHALGWVSLSNLYEWEVSWGMNPLPDSIDRSTRAARRSVEIDPVCQMGWTRLMSAHFRANDWSGMRNAGDRVIALNPFNQNTVGVAGFYFAFMGDWDRGIPMVRRAIDLDPNHLGLLHSGLFVDHYRKKEYEEALAQAKRVNAFETALVSLSLASAAGQLGRADEARAALEALDRNHPKHTTLEAVRSHWTSWLRENELIDRLIEGFEKAQALLEAPASQPAVANAPASGRTASIAVLPFTDMSAAKDQDWFCDGIAEEILNALSQLRGLRVAARGSAFSFKGKSEDLHSIGEKLNVGTILEGSVRRSGDRVRITAQLSDVKDGFQLWSERYDREMKDIFDVQDEIARAIAERLKVTLAGGGEARLVPKATDNIEAYETCLKARAMLLRRGRFIVQAQERFQRVVEIDPNYALAWTGIAEVHTLLGFYGMVRAVQALPQALLAARRAIELDPASGEAYAAEAYVLLYLGDPEGAERRFKQALELNPNNSQARGWYGVFDLGLTRGRFDEGIVEARRALDADPLSAYLHSILGLCLAFAGRLDEALGHARSAVSSDPDSLIARWVQSHCLVFAGKFEEAGDAAENVVRMSGDLGFYTSLLVSTLAQSGRMDEAQALRARLRARTATEYIAFTNLAEASFAVGDLADALSSAQRAAHDREPQFLLWARHGPGWWAWLRQQPEWPAMLKQLDEPPETSARNEPGEAPR